MKDEWYGDKRDLVKWGVLLRLAETYRSDKIIQVAYFRPTLWPRLEIDGEFYAIPDVVIDHFRDIRKIVKMTTRPRIQVLSNTISDRASYTNEVLAVLAESDAGPRIVFLDPDTGLAPTIPNLEHALEQELLATWNVMRNQDVLVLYQHQPNRNNTPWIGPKRQQFEKAIRLGPDTAKVAWAPAFARDMVLFYAVKGTEDV